MDWSAIGLLAGATTLFFVLASLGRGKLGPSDDDSDEACDCRPVPRLVKLGAVWPFIVGVPLFVVGGLMLASGLMGLVGDAADPSFCTQATPFACNLARGLITAGPVVIGLGVVHLATGAGMWHGRTWGRWLGAGLGALGLVGAAWYAGQYAGQASWDDAIVLGVALASAYGLTLVAAILWYPADGQHT
jgi:hypothetical protein